VVTGSLEHSKCLVYQGVDCSYICEYLSLLTRYPIESTAAFFLPKAYSYLEKNFSFHMTSDLLDKDDDTHLCLFARATRVQTHYLRLLSKQHESQRSIEYRNLRPKEVDLLLQTLKSLKLLTIPYDLHNVGYEEGVKRLIALSLEHMLSADGYQPISWQEPTPSPDQEEINKLLAILDLPPGSTWEEVRTAYSYQARQYHPDTNASLEHFSQEFQDLAKIPLGAIIDAYHKLRKIMKP